MLGTKHQKDKVRNYSEHRCAFGRTEQIVPSGVGVDHNRAKKKEYWIYIHQVGQKHNPGLMLKWIVLDMLMSHCLLASLSFQPNTMSVVCLQLAFAAPKWPKHHSKQVYSKDSTLICIYCCYQVHILVSISVMFWKMAVA